MIPSQAFFIVSAILFVIGVIGAITRRNAIIVFMSIEMMLNAVSLTLVSASSTLHSIDGVMFVFFIMTVAAAEAAVGLAIFLLMYRKKDTIKVDEFNLLKG